MEHLLSLVRPTAGKRFVSVQPTEEIAAMPQSGPSRHGRRGPTLLRCWHSPLRRGLLEEIQGALDDELKAFSKVDQRRAPSSGSSSSSSSSFPRAKHHGGKHRRFNGTVPTSSQRHPGKTSPGNDGNSHRTHPHR